MRIDLFLKNTGLVPRRTLAQKACQGGLVKLDGRSAKPSAEVRVGQEISVQLGMSRRRYRVLQLAARAVRKDLRKEYVELLESQAVEMWGPGAGPEPEA
jgi:ribosomal 50S subunit-recycling heat shock protein